MTAPNVGDPAPDVSLPLHTGQSVRLADLCRDRVVVVFFYPKDGTPVCTKEACAFRDAYQKFVDAGAAVVGLSGDSAKSHEKFVSDHRLPFPLVVDADGSLRKAFGVSRPLGIVPGRETFVIDRQGVIRSRFRALFASDKHVETSLDAVRELQAAD